MIDETVDRKPLNLDELILEIDEVFTFRSPSTSKQQDSCQHIQSCCKALAMAIVEMVPEGKEQVIAVNNLLGAALWASHGITKRQVTIVTVPPPPEWLKENPAAVPVEEPTIEDERKALGLKPKPDAAT